MKKIGMAIAAIAVSLVVAAVAIAQTKQTNTYKVTGKISPSKAGSKKKPIPVSVNFDYTVGEANGLRPSPVKVYDILFDGLRVNGSKFPKCTAATINSTGSDAKCSKKALVGTGKVLNEAGPSNNTADKSTTCYLDLKVYNGGASKAALYLKGGPNDPRGASYSCPLTISQAIDANYIKKRRGTSLRFTVQSTLLHPLPGVDNAVVNVTSSIRKITRKVRGKTVGYYESIGGCRAKKRYITVSFTDENGLPGKAQKKLSCRR